MCNLQRISSEILLSVVVLPVCEPPETSPRGSPPVELPALGSPELVLGKRSLTRPTPVFAEKIEALTSPRISACSDSSLRPHYRHGWPDQVSPSPGMTN